MMGVMMMRMTVTMNKMQVISANTQTTHCQTPNSEKPKCEEYKRLFSRASDIFNDIKNDPIQCQQCRKPKKKSFSNRKVEWMNWLAFELLESLGDKEKSDLAGINSILYSVAAVMSFKEGQEFTLDGMKKIEKGREVPKWKQRLEKQIGWLRKEADILKALLENKVKNNKMLITWPEPPGRY